MICINCGEEMIIDDEDFRFIGNKDIYWKCTNCCTSCIEEIRYSQTFKEHWTNEDKNINKTIKHNIDTTLRVKGGRI